MEAMQGKDSHEFLSPPMLEDATTIPWNVENVEHNYVHNFANNSSSISGEEVGEEETNDKVKEPKPYIPPTTFLCRLRKSKWNTPTGNKYFQDLISYRCKFEALEFS
ncbi:hypothetical protein QYF36_010518 [Acer negundo]|nr:hypothetical protein QYF36_010518 [Acer negundo]